MSQFILNLHVKELHQLSHHHRTRARNGGKISFTIAELDKYLEGRRERDGAALVLPSASQGGA
jgi:hypothetical protein